MVLTVSLVSKFQLAFSDENLGDGHCTSQSKLLEKSPIVTVCEWVDVFVNNVEKPRDNLHEN